MLSLLITVIVAGVIFYLIYWALSQIPLPAPFMVVARVILALVADHIPDRASDRRRLWRIALRSVLLDRALGPSFLVECFWKNVS